MQVKKRKNKEDKVVAYLDGEDAFPSTEKVMKGWIKKVPIAGGKPAKIRGS
jgi:hypothetical protein